MFLIMWLVAIGSLVLIVVLLFTGSSTDPVEARLREVASEPTSSGHAPSLVTTSAGLVVPPSMAIRPDAETNRRLRAERQKASLRDRLVQAGLYQERSNGFFTLVRALLALLPLGIGVGLALSGMTTLLMGAIVGGSLSAFGTIAPSFWLDFLKADRQKRIQRALPDALDVIVVCLEGGLSLNGAFARVANELSDVHPLLAMELKIVEREAAMGRSMGEAMRNFANRFDLEELRSMAGVIVQAERFGTSVVKALTVYADVMRLKRQQRAEEMAHKAAVKILFPTVLFIFPAIFVVILGPAVMQVLEAFAKTGFAD